MNNNKTNRKFLINVRKIIITKRGGGVKNYFAEKYRPLQSYTWSPQTLVNLFLEIVGQARPQTLKHKQRRQATFHEGP